MALSEIKDKMKKIGLKGNQRQNEKKSALSEIKDEVEKLALRERNWP